jgi:predicted membrane protein
VTSTPGKFKVGVVYALVASEYAHAPTILTVICLCVLFSAVVGRWWTLALPVVLAGAVFALMPIDSYYERTPEDVQAGVLFGAVWGLALAAAALLVRQYIGLRRETRRTVRSE